MGEKLTKLEQIVLAAVTQAVNGRTVYIRTWLLNRWRDREIDDFPTNARLLKSLRALEAQGLVYQVDGVVRSYGYEWSITPAGRAALSQEKTG